MKASPKIRATQSNPSLFPQLRRELRFLPRCAPDPGRGQIPPNASNPDRRRLAYARPGPRQHAAQTANRLLPSIHEVEARNRLLRPLTNLPW